MKLLALLIMLAALYLLYRIAFPKQKDTVGGSDAVPPKKPKPVAGVMGESRFVLPDRSKPLQTPATSQETGKVIGKQDIFAAEKGGEPNPEIMSIPLENGDSDNEDDIDAETEEEAEELNQTLGYEAIPADGVGYDELQTAVKVVAEQPEEVSEETGETLLKLENTDMFEMLVSGNDGKMQWMKSVIDRHIRSIMPETEDKTSDTIDYGDFNVADYLS
jgi:hypothetical protein